jgi:hypothetical protein
MKQQARVAALRSHVPPRPYFGLPEGGVLLPRARLKAGMVARVGLLTLVGITPGRFIREQRRGLLEVFNMGAGLFALEVPPGHPGPPEDFLWELQS